MSRSSGQELVERAWMPDRPDAATPATASLAPPVPWAEEPRETNGMTSRLILAYVERRGGRAAVERVLQLCGLEDAEPDLRNEGHWFSFATKVRLFVAAADVLDDPFVARHVGECAIDLNVGDALKLALRALGSPRLVYENVVRANGKFTTTARMDLLDSGSSHARVAYVDVTGTPYHPLDCQYNQGMLSCVPALFGLPLARVSHPVCAGDGGASCVYDVTWESGGAYVRFALGSVLAGAGLLTAAGLADTSLLPVAGVIAAGLTGVATHRALGVRRRVWRQLETEVREQAQVTQRLNASLQDIASELRLEDVLAKVTANVQSTLEGREFALLVDDGDGPRCRRSSNLPAGCVDALEAWVAGRRLREAPLVLEDLSTVPELSELVESGGLPLRSLCSAPLTYHGESLGVLIALAPNARVFLPRDVDVLQSFATQAAIALTNARLFEAQQELASRDPLTGLLNHREFHESVARELERCRRYGGRVSVALFDLDGFKAVNDISGHAEGDRVLRRTAEVLSESCRSSDIAFRIGGDEFALLLPESGAADAHAVAERAAIELRSSFGVAVWPDDGPSKEGLLARADENLYGMKRARPGKHRERSGAAAAEKPKRLAAASRLFARMSALTDPDEIARVTVDELWRTFGCYLAVILRIHEDGKLRPVAGAGDLVHAMDADFERWEQSLDQGIAGRVARTGEPAMIADTQLDPDYLGSDVQANGGSELAVPIRVAGEIWGVLNMESLASGSFVEADLLFIDTVAAHAGGALHRSQLFAELESTFTTTLAVLSDALEAKDSYTAAHADDVADFAVRVAGRLGLDDDELRIVRYGALLHDIGKIGVRSEVLKKAGPLTVDEFEEIKQHTVIGAKMLERIPFFAPVQPIVRSAHERWDGRGYPDGLAGEDIPLGARIVCACDAFHAMTSDRPYSKARSVEAAAAEMRRCSGTQFDPRVVEALLEDLGSNGARVIGHRQ
jgi:diguanylate cyclase (GGDEF)-like protein/putative nucleotidyltransferase with HDIG domain